MTDERWSVLGVAGTRSTWFGEVARWSTSGIVAMDFVPCLSTAEVRARLAGGRPFSALLVGATTPGLDRDLIATAAQTGLTTIVVGDDHPGRWTQLGVAEVLAESVDPATLLAALRRHATPLSRLEHTIEPTPVVPTRWRGRLVAVTGPPGAGTSLTAIAVTQHLAADASGRGLVLLADLALDADQAMLHDTRDVGPGLQELVEGHRGVGLTDEAVRALTRECPGRRYRLLLGLRRHRDWTAVRPRAFVAALDGLLRTHRTVVADVDADTEGEAETGSIDVEERNVMARTVLRQADVVVLVGGCGPQGLHALARTIRRTTRPDDPRPHLVVLNRAPRSRRRRARSTAALAALLGPELAGVVGNPVFVAATTDVDRSVLDGVALASGPWRTVQRQVAAQVAALADRPAALELDPVPVTPGRTGSWSQEAG